MSKNLFDDLSAAGKLIAEQRKYAHLPDLYDSLKDSSAISTAFKVLQEQKRFESLIHRESLNQRPGALEAASHTLKLNEIARSGWIEDHLKLLQGFQVNIKSAIFPDKILASGFLETISKSAGIDVARSALMGRFLPEREHISFKALAQGIRLDTSKVFASARLHYFLPSAQTVASSFVPLEKVWRDGSVASVSLEGMTGLMSLKNAISQSPFSAESNIAVTSLLGAWKHSAVEASLLDDWKARQRVYFEQGFDPRLTAFPTGTYTSALFQSGLLRDDLFTPCFTQKHLDVEQYDEDEEVESNEVKNNLMIAYEIILNLEMQLRAYLAEKMENQFGTFWYKQRVNGNIYTQWKAKRAIAAEKMEEEQPILSYADFTDYERIIITKNNWEEAFKNDFNSLIDIQASFHRLYVIRNCTMHIRPISNEDMTLLTVESRRILRAIGRLSESE